jgi:hypothetical protein
MKKLIITLMILAFTLEGFSQTTQPNSEIFGISGTLPQRIYSTDSALLQFLMTTNKGAGSISITQLSNGAPTVSINTVPDVWNANTTLIKGFWVKNLTPGYTYIFRGTCVASSGTNGTILDSIQVIKPPVPPRLIVSTTVLPDGKKLTIYSDNTYTIQ